MPAGPIIGLDEPILITGAAGFIGKRVIETLLQYGYRNLHCLVRPSSDCIDLQAICRSPEASSRVKIIKGNLLSREDCVTATRGVAVIYHLAAGRGEKSFPDAFMNSVVTTRNLLEAVLIHKCLRRIVSVSSFSVYSNQGKEHRNLLDERCPVETHPELRHDAYCFAKVKQDETLIHYGKKHALPYVLVRPGFVYGPGNEAITGRVGLRGFGPFLHLGGSNPIPLTYVDNCAEAIVLAGLQPGVDGEVFNVVDDDLPTSRKFLRLYKKKVRSFRSIYVPHWLSYLLCWLWEAYANWSEGQLPPVYNRKLWHAAWKKTNYTNQKLKAQLGWRPKISTMDALGRYFESCRIKAGYA